MADKKLTGGRNELLHEFKCHVEGFHDTMFPGYSLGCDVCQAYREALHWEEYEEEYSELEE